MGIDTELKLHEVAIDLRHLVENRTVVLFQLLQLPEQCIELVLLNFDDVGISGSELLDCQTFGGWEHLVIDDRSSDRGPDLVRTHVAREPRCRLLTPARTVPSPCRRARPPVHSPPAIRLKTVDTA